MQVVSYVTVCSSSHLMHRVPLSVSVFSSISLVLLPERAATLMVYEDVVEIVSGFQGKCSGFCINVGTLAFAFVYPALHTSLLLLLTLGLLTQDTIRSVTVIKVQV